MIFSAPLSNYEGEEVEAHMGATFKPCTIFVLQATLLHFLQREGGSDHAAANAAELSARNSTAWLGNKILIFNKHICYECKP